MKHYPRRGGRPPRRDDYDYADLWDYIREQPRTKTYQQMADECAISASQFSTYMTGRRRPSLETALRMVEHVRISLDGLLHGKPPAEYRQRRAS